MANEEVLGPRKTMFVLVIVVGCFAVLWPRILSPLILGNTKDQLKPNQYDREAAVKQERPLMRGAGPHPALRERGRAIPPGAPTPPSRGPVPLPAHVRVRSSPLSVYFDLDIKPPPIPGMRPPLGSPGGPVAAPKSSMGFVMPIYTICIIVFFVYTLSKILFKRTGAAAYDPISPDPQFRRRVFREESRSSPETKLVVTAISGLVAEVQQQMEASYTQNQQRQDVQDNHTRLCTNGTVLGNSTVHIVTSEYKEEPKENGPNFETEKEPSLESKSDLKESSPEPKESSPEPIDVEEQKPLESKESVLEAKESVGEYNKISPENEKESSPEPIEMKNEIERPPIFQQSILEPTKENVDIIKLSENIETEKEKDSLTKATEDFLNEARDEQNELKIVTTSDLDGTNQDKLSTTELLEEALKEDKDDEVTEDGDAENASVKVVGMELTAHTADGGAWPQAQPPPVTPLPPLKPPHEADMVKSIFLETEIPQQSRVLVADFGEDRPEKAAPKHSSLVVSGKMTLSLIQDAPRDTPERELDSTLDDFTTASAVTQSAAEKEGHLSDEEIEEEIEVEEIEEEIEEEEDEEELEDHKEIKKVVPNTEEIIDEEKEEIKTDIKEVIPNTEEIIDEEKEEIETDNKQVVSNTEEIIEEEKSEAQKDINEVVTNLEEIDEDEKDEDHKDLKKEVPTEEETQHEGKTLDEHITEETNDVDNKENEKELMTLEDSVKEKEEVKEEAEIDHSAEAKYVDEQENLVKEESENNNEDTAMQDFKENNDETKYGFTSIDEPKNLELESDNKEDEAEVNVQISKKKKGAKVFKEEDSDE